jgi:hypothetical protein
MMKSRWMGWTENVAGMAEKKIVTGFAGEIRRKEATWKT